MKKILTVIVVIIIIGGIILATKKTNAPTEVIQTVVETNSQSAPNTSGITREEDRAVEPATQDLSNNKITVAKSVGTYEIYSADKLALASTGKVILYFHAPWCPTCRGVDADIVKNSANIPDGVHIIKTDYDSMIELKKKYGVTYQHTFVQVDEKGNLIAKWSGSPTLADIVKRVN